METMGHNTGWLALGAGLAGGADVILIPEIPYDTEVVAQAIRQRSRSGKRFSIVCVSEGAMRKATAVALQKALAQKEAAKTDEELAKAKQEIEKSEARRAKSTQKLTEELEKLTRLESHTTILGHVQRGGIPSAVDRLLATKLGTGCAQYIQEGRNGIMVAAQGDGVTAVPLEEVVGKRKMVPSNHPWIQSARLVGTCLGDE
jgi:6-phosphofructokinase 1